MPKRPRTEKDRIAARAWYLKNKEVCKLRAQEWHKIHRDRSNMLKKEWKLRNPEKERKLRDEARWLKAGMVGATIEKYDQLMEQQKKVCAICHKQNTYNRNLAWDHDHTTGEPRGLLCGSCNYKVGQYEEMVRRRLNEKMISYLNHWVTSS